jgi:type II restriction enzyme
MRLEKDELFLLSEVYNAEKVLAKAHPNNNHIKAKIRQQIQVLRDYGYVTFTQKKGLYQLAIDISVETK